jgi:hypothetical protein
MYAIQVLNSIEDNKPSLEDHPILREYQDVFQKRYQVYLQEEILTFQYNLYQERCQCLENPI